ncbi:hypothetical protein FBU59_000617, partial [Linderina macrospora]
MSVDLGRTISIDGTSAGALPSNQNPPLRHRRSGSLEAARSPSKHQTSSSASQADTGHTGFSGTFLGVGIGSNIFNKLSSKFGPVPLSPRTAARAMSPAGDAHDRRPGSRAMSESETSATGSDGFFNLWQQRKVSDNFDSSVSNSSASPLRTEPMRSHAPSNFNTPYRNVLGLIGATPGSALRKTPGSAVNPLARHLAMKSIQLSQKGNPLMSRNEVTPTPGGRSAKSFMSPFSSGAIGDASMMDVKDIQRELEQFAALLKADNLVAQTELQQSEEAWVEMQREILRLTTELSHSEGEREAMHAQMSEMHRERVELDADKQRLGDRCNELTNNIQQWQRRIGDIESDRQGVWKEDQQSRAELLAEIVNCENHVRAAQRETEEIREKAHAALRSARSQVLAECKDRMAALQAENDQLHEHLIHAEAGYEMATGENRRLEADAHEARIEGKGATERAVASEMELAAAKSKAVVAEQRVQVLERQALELSEAAHEAQAIEAGLREQLQDNLGKIKSLGDTINDQSYEISVLKMGHREGSTEYETAMDLLSPEQKRSVSSQSEDITMMKQRHRQEVDQLNSDIEVLTEQLRDLIEKDDDSSGSDVELPDMAEPKHPVLEVSEDTEKLKRDHREEVEQYKSQISMLKEQLEDLIESKSDYKKQCTELIDMAETAKSKITKLEVDLSEAAERETKLRQQMAAKDQAAHETTGNSDDIELEMLRESEERLNKELDAAERESADLSERARSIEDRNRQLVARNDELSQRTARLETEISDMQLRWSNQGVDTTASEEIEVLHKALADMERELANRHGDSDRLRQELARREIEFDQVQSDLVRVRQEHEAEMQAQRQSEAKIVGLRSTEQKLKAELKELSAKLLQKDGAEPQTEEPVAGKAEKLGGDYPGPEKLVQREFELSHSLRTMQSHVASLEMKVQKTQERRDLLEREERFLSEQLVNCLLRNKTLRSELTELILRRTGKMRELQYLQNQHGGDVMSRSMSDDGSMSMKSNGLNDTPSLNQVLDGSRPKFFSTLDSHLKEMNDIIDNADTQSQRSVPTTVSRTSPLRRAASQPTERRDASRVLTPIHEENAVQSHVFKDAAVQCTLTHEVDSTVVVEQYEIELDNMHDRVCQLEDECKALRTSVAEVKQERDQFKVSHEDASEHVSKLTGQIEDLSEEHERMRAENIATARISRRLMRQLRVLKRILGRLALYDSQALSKSKSEPSTTDDKDREEVLALEEDDAMINATLDRPLDAGDDDNDSLNGAVSGQGTGDKLISQDRVLERMGSLVSELYTQAKRIRGETFRAKSERVRMVKRLAKSDAANLPSFELSSQWGRKVRQRSYTVNFPGAADTEHESGGMARASTESPGTSSQMLDDTEPPASLFMPDESAIISELAASRRNQRPGNKSAPPLPGNGSYPFITDAIPPTLEVARLVGHLRTKAREAKLLKSEVTKFEKVNADLQQKNDRLHSENLLMRSEKHALEMRMNSHSSNRANTPRHGTDWDDFESIKQELERSRKRNISYFDNVEQLCTILSQHTIDRVLADNSDDFAGHGSSLPASAAQNNVFRKLLFEMAETLEASNDLDEKKSLRDNFLSMAAAVRVRLDERSSELHQLQGELAMVRQANDEAASASIQEKVDQYEELVLGLESQLADAQTQLADAQTQLADTQTRLAGQRERSESLSSTIDRLRQQCAKADEDFASLKKHCVKLDEDIEAMQLENHGLQNEVTSKQQELDFQIEEYNALHQTVEELTTSKAASDDDHSNAMERERLRQEWTAAARQEEAESWHNKEFIVRQTLETQIKAVRWENSVWKDLIRSMMTRPIRNLPSQHPSSTSGLAGSGGTSVEESNRLVTEAFDDVDHEVERAIERTMILQDNMLAGPVATGHGDVSRSHASFINALNKVLRGLEISISRKWRENVCNCVESVVTASYQALVAVSGVSGESGSGSSSKRSHRGRHSASSSGSGSSNSTGNPQITDEQKALIREHHARKMEDLKHQFQQKIDDDRAVFQNEVEHLKTEAKKDKRMLTNECRYLRGRI